MTADTGRLPGADTGSGAVTPSAPEAALDAALDAVPVIAIVRLRTADGADAAVSAVVAGGVRAVEITRTTGGRSGPARSRAGRGAITPTELDAATEAGATYLKLFPASSVGPGYLREILAPMPELRVIPTGGVRAVDVGTWAAAGAHAVAAGSALVHPDLVAARDWAAITTRAGAYVAAWTHHRRPGPP